MARLTKRLPIVAIPKQRPVAAVRDDVIDDARGDDPILSLVLGAKRMSSQERGRGLAPPSIISPRVCGASLPLDRSGDRDAVRRTVPALCQRPATRSSARPRTGPRHVSSRQMRVTGFHRPRIVPALPGKNDPLCRSLETPTLADTDRPGLLASPSHARWTCIALSLPEGKLREALSHENQNGRATVRVVRPSE